MKFMYCEKCNKNRIKKLTNCPTCGSTLVKSKQGISIASIICVIATVLVILALVIGFLYFTFMDRELANSGSYSDSYGWGFLGIVFTGMFVIPCYLFLSIISIILDMKIMKKSTKILKDIVILFLSVGIPLLIALFPLIYSVVENVIPSGVIGHMIWIFPVCITIIAVVNEMMDKKKNINVSNEKEEKKVENSKYCSNCGNELSMDVKFCSKCGNKI